MDDNTFTINTEINTDGIKKGTQDVSNSLTKMAGTVAKAGAMSALAFAGLLKILPRVVSAVTKGFKDLAKYNEDFNNSMSNILNSTRYMRGALTSAFGALIEAIEPIATTVMDSLAGVFNKFAEVVAYLNGRDTFAMAIKQQEDYASAINKTQGKLASFDKLNVIGKKTGLAFTTEDVKISDDVKKRYEGIKKTLEEIKKLFKGDLTEFDAGNAGTVIGGAIVKGLDLVNEIVKSIDTEELGRKLGEVIGEIDIAEVAVKILEILVNIADGAVKGVAGFIQGWFDKNPWTCSIAIALALGKLTSVFSGSAFTSRVWDALTTKVPGLTKASSLLGKLAFTLTLAWLFREITNDFVEKIDNEWVQTLVELLRDGVTGAIVGASFNAVPGGFVIGLTLGIMFNWDKINTKLGELEDKLNEAFEDIEKKFQEWLEKKTGKKITLPEVSVPKAFGENGALSNSLKDTFTFKSIRTEQYPLQNFNNAMKEAGSKLEEILTDTWEDTKYNFFAPLYKSITGKSPKLATGAVVPPNAPFTAVLGDNKRETEIVSPLSTMRQAVREAMSDQRIVLQVDGKTLFEAVVNQNNSYKKRTGGSAFV